MGRLEGKVAVVTGGARGQGEAEIRLFVTEGARVVVADVLDEPGAALAAELGDAALFVHLDVGDEGGWADLVDRVGAELGRLDVLVNNAGIHHMVRIEDETLAAFERTLRVNLVGTFLGMRACAPLLRADGGGSIVNISSTAALTGYAAHAAYGASKWGVRGITKTAAVELGPEIRVNSVHPGAILTDMLGAGRVKAGFDRLPLRRAGEAHEVAELVCFLASGASGYITGCELTIDGGVTL